MGKFEFAYNLNGANHTPIVQPFPVASTQTLLVGDLVYLSSGKVTKAGNTTASVLGVMAQDSDGAAEGTMVNVHPIMPGQVFRATADADATSHVLAAQAYDINASTQTVDVGDNSGGCIIILKLGDSVTDVYVAFTAFDLA